MKAGDPMPRKKKAAAKADQTKQERIADSVKAMTDLLQKQNMQADKLKAADGIIQRVAFMQITLEDLEQNINEKGTTEEFSQTEGISYDRERPASAIYNKLIKNYTSACKQLFDLLPAEEKDNAAGLSPEEKALLDMMKSGRRNE